MCAQIWNYSITLITSNSFIFITNYSLFSICCIFSTPISCGYILVLLWYFILIKDLRILNGLFVLKMTRSWSVATAFTGASQRRIHGRKTGLITISLYRPKLWLYGEFTLFKLTLILPAYSCPTAGQRPLLIHEGTSIYHDACFRRIGDFRLILLTRPGFFAMFFFTDVN